MEPSGIMCEGEWDSLSGMYAINEESEFMIQLLGEFSPSSVLDGDCRGSLGMISSNAALKVNSESFVYSSDPSSSNACFYSQETSAYNGNNGDKVMNNYLFSSGHGDYSQVDESNQSFECDKIPCYFNSVDFGVEKEENIIMRIDENSTGPKNRTKAEAEYDENIYQTDVFHREMKSKVPTDERRLLVNSNKRSLNVEAQKNKRNVKPKKGKKISETTIVDEDKIRIHISSSCSKDDVSDTKSLDISNLTMEEDIAAASSKNVKTRANRGSATDPQSLYARKRREKINERLKILQGLVPNGTKVDISTMLDEAVQYVKFLQLQIKLLSSDDMWMYAPLAYNGMDLGLDI